PSDANSRRRAWPNWRKPSWTCRPRSASPSPSGACATATPGCAAPRTTTARTVRCCSTTKGGRTRCSACCQARSAPDASPGPDLQADRIQHAHGLAALQAQLVIGPADRLALGDQGLAQVRRTAGQGQFGGIAVLDPHLEAGRLGAAVGADDDVQALAVEIDLADGFQRLVPSRALVRDDRDLLSALVGIDDATAQQRRQGDGGGDGQAHQFASAGAEWMTRVVGFSVAMMMQPDSMGAATAATARAMMRRRIGVPLVGWRQTASLAVGDHVNNRKGRP